MTQNWENWEITKSGWLDPLYQDMWLKVWYRVYLLQKSLFILCTSLHNTHELSIHLCFDVFSSFPMCLWTLLIKRLFSHILIEGIKPTTFGNFSVFSVLCHNCSYLSWETSQQNFLWKFLFAMASPNFWDNNNFSCETIFYICSKTYC